MAAFPSPPPSPPYVFTPTPGGPSWLWDGQKWQAHGGGGVPLTAVNVTVDPIGNWSPGNMQQALADLHTGST